MRRATLLTALLLVVATTPAVAVERLYLHLVVTEVRGDVAVEMTLPFAFVSRVARAASVADLRDCRISFDRHAFELADLRRAAVTLRRESRPVVVLAGEDHVTFSREGGIVTIRSDSGWDRVVTRIPEDLFFAAFPDDRRIDAEAALALLASRGGGTLLMSSGDDTVVRVWVDRRNAIMKRRTR
jgi:hypothetical protein